MEYNKLIEIHEAEALIKKGDSLIIAADESILKKLPKGNWIGGTIPYFMDISGGCFTKEKVFVTALSKYASNNKICEYTTDTIEQITQERFSNGYSFILVPGFSDILVKYALKAQNLDKLYDSPIVGWVTGIDLNETSASTPKIINGETGELSDKKAISFHVELPQDKIAVLEILNLFEQGSGDTFEFLSEGFSCQECLINGQKKNLADYITDNKVNTKLPLVADYSGAMINISFQQIDTESKTVFFYAPLRKNTEYRLAKPVSDYVSEFNALIPKGLDNVVFSCNCILNYLYSELEGKKTGAMTGPVTFGEIAYVLVNQTLVYLSVVDS